MVTTYGIIRHMETHTETQKVTVNLPKKDLRAAQDYTGLGITETLRLGIEELKRKKAYQDLLNLRGKIKFSLSLDELRYDE